MRVPLWRFAVFVGKPTTQRFHTNDIEVKSPCAVDGETFISKINKIEKHRNLRWYIEERNRVYISLYSLNHNEKKKFYTHYSIWILKRMTGFRAGL
jgi:hypothetical protein